MSRLGRAGSSITAAGVTTRVADEGAANCLAFEDRPETPQRLRKFRKSFFGPGERHVHPGLVDDNKGLVERRQGLSASQQAFGVSSKSSEHVQNVFSHGPQSSVTRIIEENKERMYKGAAKKLGKSVSHGHHLPGHVTDPNFRFGLKGEADAESVQAKSIIYPQQLEDNQEKEMLYMKSHGKYPPGEQRKRNYEWGGIDASQQRFGKVERVAHDGGAAGCMSGMVADAYAPDTHIIAKKTFDFSNTKPQLGKCKPLGASSAGRGHTFGVPSSVAKMGKDGPSAGGCIRGNYSLDEQMPDGDLGRAARPGFRNINKDDRVFGCPSVRSDIPEPARRSVADNQAYGTDSSAQSLLYPSRFNTVGVDDEEFIKQRDPQEVREIFESCGFNYSDPVFGMIWWQAANGCDWNGDGIVSVEEFRSAMNDYEDHKERGQDPPWIRMAARGWQAQLAADSR